MGSTRFFGQRLRLLVCERCGLGRLDPRLKNSDLARYYAHDYRPTELGHSGADERQFERGLRRGRRLRAFLEERGLLPPVGSSVVELGTGVGGILEAFREAGHPVAGSDLDPGCVEFARARGLAVVRGERIPAELAPSPAGLAVLSHLVEHLPSPVDTIRALEPWLGRDTIVYVEVPGLRSGIAPSEQIRVPHLYYYELASLERALGDAGLELVTGDESVRAVFRPR